MKEREEELPPDAPRRTFNWERVGMILMPVLAVSTVTGAVFFAVNGQMNPVLALLIGLILGALATAISIAGQGNSSFEVMMGSAVIIVLTLLMFPVFTRARYRAQQRRARQALSVQNRSVTQPKPAQP